MIHLNKLLVEQFNVSQADLDKALSYQSRYDGRVEKILVNMGCLTEEELAPLYSELLGYPLFDEAQFPQWQVSESVPFSVNQELKALDCLLVSATETKWQVACLDPLDLSLAEYLNNHPVELSLSVATEAQLQTFFYEIESQTNDSLDDDELTGDEEARLRVENS